MSHTILLFEENHMRFDEYDLIVASLLILDINKEAVELHFPTMRCTWLEEFSTSISGCTDLDLEILITNENLKYEFLKIVENTYKYIEINVHGSILNLGSIDGLINLIGICVTRQYPSDLILVALNGLKELLT